MFNVFCSTIHRHLQATFITSSTVIQQCNQISQTLLTQGDFVHSKQFLNKAELITKTMEFPLVSCNYGPFLLYGSKNKNNRLNS